MKCEICGNPIEVVRREESEVYYQTDDDGRLSEAEDRETHREVTSAEVIGSYCGCKECPYVYARVQVGPKEEEYKMLTWSQYNKLREEGRAW